MKIKIILHRGYPVHQKYENSLLSVYNSIIRIPKLLKQKKLNNKTFDIKNWISETDISFFNGQWHLRHDFVSSQTHSRYDSLEDLLCVLRKNGIQNKEWIMILDIKWDFIYNQNDDESNAFLQLFELLQKYELGWKNHLLLQFSHMQHFLFFRTISSEYKLGLLIEQPIFNGDLHHPDFLMVNLSKFSSKDLEIARNFSPIIYGYGCSNISVLHYYEKIYHYIDGIVCDLYI